MVVAKISKAKHLLISLNTGLSSSLSLIILVRLVKKYGKRGTLSFSLMTCCVIIKETGSF